MRGMVADSTAVVNPPRAPARVVLTSGFSQRYTGGIKTFDIEAKTLRAVIKAMEARYPGVGEILEEETSVVIDGEMHEVVYTQPLKPGSEVEVVIDGIGSLRNPFQPESKT